jgi:hypothetical protein
VDGAWQRRWTGQGVAIGMIEQNIQTDHPDLADNSLAALSAERFSNTSSSWRRNRYVLERKVSFDSFCPEAELLLCCTRTQMDAERAERIKVLLQEDLDWKVLLALASQHGVLPCLCWHLKPYADVIPGVFLEELRDNRSIR